MLNGYPCISAGSMAIIEYFIMHNNTQRKGKLCVGPNCCNNNDDATKFYYRSKAEA